MQLMATCGALALLVPLALAVTAVGCGGEAVVDPASGGSGSGTATGTGAGTATGAGSGSGTGTGSGDLCSNLEENFIDKLLAALACDPQLDIDPCTGEQMVFDNCGCDVAANEHNPVAASAALDAYDTWVDAGCGPYPCEWCIPPVPAGCQPGSDGSGMCVSLVN